ncbi:mevalonate kinase [Drosophila grimshawi]|uniref:Mevalonate kinase n=1 Tax=Drosophila grimshawi TaxID=7222 RepID=B4J707_DROGR|nr:mevalonate kinase [Drosophila grimshawi]EDW00995.1 GH20706 [Drosophila grimshawi]
MLKFQVHSPGKVILHGEHAVVYQKPALAAVVGLGTKLQLRSQAGSQVASFQLEALNCTVEIELNEFNAFVANFRNKYPSDKLESTAKLMEEVRAEVAKQLERTMGTTPKQHTQRAFLSIYYLLAGAVLSAPGDQRTLQTGFQVQVETELNVGAGLGSSASYGAALAAAFLILAGHFDENSYLQEENLALISHWAYESERVNHGTPSGVDNTVCTYGGILRFVKGQGFQALCIQKPLSILLVDSRISRSTADIVAKVRHLGEEFPQLIEAIWQACEQLVNAAVPLYESFGNAQDDSQKFEKLERLFQINNDLLKAIGVSHPKLEQIFTIAFKRGFFSKLTGAGAGGYAIVLLPENYECNEVYWKLKEELEAAGFGVHVTTAGGVGLRVSSLDN